MKKSTKKFTSTFLAAASVAGIVVPATQVFAEEKMTLERAKELIAYANKEKNFAEFNIAYAAVLELKLDETKQNELLAQLPAWKDVVTPDVQKGLDMIVELSKKLELKEYDATEAYLSKEIKNARNMQYLLGELTSWGRKGVYTDDVTAAVDAIVKVWKDKTEAAEKAAQEAIAKVKNANNVAYLNQQLAEATKDIVREVKVEGLTAVGAKKLKVTFNKAVDTAKAVLTVKKGSIAFTNASVEWNADKTEATITLVSKLTAGDYTVTASGIEIDAAKASATVKAESEKVAKVSIDSDFAPLEEKSTDVTFSYKVLNQYGEDITKDNGLTWTTSQGAIELVEPSLGIKKVTGSFIKDQYFTVTAVDSVTGVYASKTLKVSDSAKVSEVTLGGIYKQDAQGNMVEGTLNTGLSDYEAYFLKVDAVDQYGNKVSDAKLDTETTIIVPGTGVLAVHTDKFVKIGTQTYLKLDKPASAIAGNVDVRVIANFTGKSSTVNVVVTQASTLDVFTIESPADLVAAGETVEIPFNAYDQNGVELSETAKAALGVDFLSSTAANVTFNMSYNYKTNKAVLTLTAAKGLVDATPGNAIIMAVTKTGKVSQFSMTIKEKAVPKSIAATKDAVTLMTIGGKSALAAKNFVVLDQHDRAMTLDSTWFNSYKIQLTSATTTNVTVGAEITAADGSVDLTGIANGSSVIKAEIVGAGVKANSYEFTASTVAKSQISSYKVETVEKLFVSVDGSHDKAFDVYGVNAAGQKIALATTDYSVSSNVDKVKVTNGKINATGVVFDKDVHEKNVNLLVVINGANGPESIIKNVVVTDVAPVVKDFKLASTTDVSVSGDVLYVKANANMASLIAAFDGVDQYGVAKPLSITNILVDNVKDADTTKQFTITNNGQTTADIANAEAGDTFRLTIYADGLTKTVTVVVTK